MGGGPRPGALGARVLVAEDHADAASVLTGVLRAAGFDAQAVAHAGSVAGIVIDERVAVLVVSFSGSGIASTTSLVGELRSRPEAPLADAAIVALVDHEVDARFGLSDAADAVLVRPVAAGALVDAVTDAAATHAAARRLRRPELRRRRAS
ncbi:MAG: response regulator transcription factor [Microthrixaceae bacterium]